MSTLHSRIWSSAGDFKFECSIYWFKTKLLHKNSSAVFTDSKQNFYTKIKVKLQQTTTTTTTANNNPYPCWNTRLNTGHIALNKDGPKQDNGGLGTVLQWRAKPVFRTASRGFANIPFWCFTLQYSLPRGTLPFCPVWCLVINEHAPLLILTEGFCSVGGTSLLLRCYNI